MTDELHVVPDLVGRYSGGAQPFRVVLKVHVEVLRLPVRKTLLDDSPLVDDADEIHPCADVSPAGTVRDMRHAESEEVDVFCCGFARINVAAKDALAVFGESDTVMYRRFGKAALFKPSAECLHILGHTAAHIRFIAYFVRHWTHPVQWPDRQDDLRQSDRFHGVPPAPLLTVMI